MSSLWSVVLVTLSFSQLFNGFCHGRCRIDVCFVLHQSTCECAYGNAKTVISNLVTMMDIGPDATQVGLLQYALQAQPVFDLHDYGNRTSVLNAISGLSPDQGKNKTSTGLDAVRTDCFGAGHGERPGVARLVILLTDGRSHNDTAAAAAAVRNDNITILVVGVNNPDVPTINAIADNVGANIFLPGPEKKPMLLPSGTCAVDSVVTALFNRFKDFCPHPYIIGVDCNDVPCGSGRLWVNIAAAGDPVYHEVLCEDGWMVLLRRQDGSVNFTKPWDDYKDGFGQLDKEFWAGLELMHHVTNNGHHYHLRMDFQPYSSPNTYAVYTTFKIGPESTYYRLYVSGFENVHPLNAMGNSMGSHHNYRFTTFDQDHDTYSRNCAQVYGGGGWWFRSCHYVYLTGLYGQYPTVDKLHGITWQNPYGEFRFAERASMMIRSL